MSFDITLQTNLSEKNRVVKTLNTIGTITGVLKDSCSIIEPSILIEGDLSDYKAVNYITISSFNRSYFVTDLVTYRTGLVQLNCHCDVLSSFWNQIKSNKAIISRQSDRYNLLLNDGSIHAYQNPHIITLPFPTGFERNDETIILMVAGAAPSGGVLTIISQPTNQYVQYQDYGVIAIFTCQAAGVGVQYQWQVDAGKQGSWVDLTSENSPSLRISYTTVTVNNNYRCLVTDSYGESLISNTVYLVEVEG